MVQTDRSDILKEARKRGMAGATVVRGVMGFGKSSHIHTSKILRLSEDPPMVIEIGDLPKRIAAFLPDLNAMIGGGLGTRDNIRVLTHRSDRNADNCGDQPR